MPPSSSSDFLISELILEFGDVAEQMPAPAPAPGLFCLEHLGKGLQPLYLSLPPCLVPSSSVLGGRFELLSFRHRPAEDDSSHTEL